MPHHVVQRGHNRNAVFVGDGDYCYYLDTLGDWARQLQVKVYAWCLMTNHVHLLLDPGDDIKSIGLLMKRLAGRQTRFVNQQENRTGSLWDGRYKMSIVDSDEYFLQRIKSSKGENGHPAGGLSLVKLPGECRTIAIRNSRSSRVYELMQQQLRGLSEIRGGRHPLI
jgi:REP element-mobilizing transposase RayT